MKTWFIKNFISLGLLVSIILNIFLYSLFQESLRLWLMADFLSENPEVQTVKEKLGEPIEVYESTSEIKHTGWGVPPWKSSRRVYVFKTSGWEKVFIVFDDEGVVNKFWIASS
jgi:hypothetical protein